MRIQSFKSTRLVIALLAAGFIGGAGVAAFDAEYAHAAEPPSAVATAPAPITQMTLPDFAQIVKRYGPAVVNITVTGSEKVSDQNPFAGQGNNDPFGNDPFFQFFRRFEQQGGGPRTVPIRAEGSGFIIDSNGIILTNAHVVRNAKVVTVKLTDRREFRAKVLGSDPKTDVAVIKIDAHDLPVVSIGKDSELQVGEWVVAIGSPFGFQNSVTAGIVSAKGRSLPDDSAVPFIQTDVPVNPGNSGGPLFNTRGQVVGINSQIYSQTGGYEGLSFAIPIDTALRIEQKLVATGKVEHGRLGISIQDVNQTLANSFKLPEPDGALVASVQKDSPASKAGLKSGDVIQSVDGQKVITAGDLPTIISMDQPGQTVKMGVWRDGKPITVTAKLGNANDKSTQVASNAPTSGQGKLGLALRPLQPQEKQEAGVDHGLLVEDASGPAAMAGVQSGDVLLSIDGTPVRSVSQARAIVAKSGDSVALLIQRGDNQIFVPVQIG
ncbi:MAG: Serine protease [Burkholderiaceae bacterium]|jgi:serine protease Do|nr:MAG: Serine protease [Burkholderiaceae bacterium]